MLREFESHRFRQVYVLMPERLWDGLQTRHRLVKLQLNTPVFVYVCTVNSYVSSESPKTLVTVPDTCSRPGFMPGLRA